MINQGCNETVPTPVSHAPDLMIVDTDESVVVLREWMISETSDLASVVHREWRSVSFADIPIV